MCSSDLGWGAGDGVTACEAPSGTVASAGDCDDGDGDVHPGADEVCDGVDDDCDGGGDPASPPSCPDPDAAATDEGGGLVALAASGFVLADEDTWTTNAAILDALATFLPTVTVGDVFADGNRDTDVVDDWSRATGFARGFTWNSGDDDVDYWFPQGITGTFDADPSGVVDGYEGVLVSWHYDPDAAGTSYDKGVRVSFADVSSSGAVTYRHALLVEPTGSAADPDFAAVEVHAGGIAWLGSLLYVADTSNGLRVFDMDRILEVSTDDEAAIGCDGSSCRAYNYKYVIPQVSRYAMPACGCDVSFSFVGLDRSSSPPSLVTGEYDADTISGQLLRWPLDEATGLLEGGAYTAASEAYVGQQDRIQGAASHDGQWWLSCSSQSGSNGLLYDVTTSGSDAYSWPYGPEDLAVDEGNGWLWSVTEHEGSRVVFAVELGAVGG